jgi:hypothetical protein
MKQHMIGWALGAVLLAQVAQADPWQEPARGSQLRSDLMDALRPHAEWALGAPVEFVIHELRWQGDKAFGMLTAQRPGGGPIDMLNSPMVTRGEFDPELIDTPHIEAFWVKSGTTWVTLHWAVGATDLWYQYEPICEIFAPLIPEACAARP